MKAYFMVRIGNLLQLKRVLLFFLSLVIPPLMLLVTECGGCCRLLAEIPQAETL